MNYGRVLSRAWQITRRYKFLWLLGFLVSLSSSLSGASSTYRFGESDVAAWASGWPSWPLGPVATVAVACAALLVALVLGVLSVIATGVLIRGVQQIEGEGTASLRSAWQVGVLRFWRLLGISLLTMLPLVIVAVIAGVLVALSILPITTSGDQTRGGLLFGVVSILCGSTLLCALLPVSIALVLVSTFAQRAAILDDLPWIEAIGRGWQVLKARLGPSLILALLLVLISLGVGVLMGVIALPVILALVALFETAGAEAWTVALGAAAAVLAFVVYSFVNGVLGTFLSSAWTLAYRELTTGLPARGEPHAETLPEP